MAQPQPVPQPLFPAVSEEEVPWARRSTGTEPVTSRSRRRIRGLPGWDPLPPGEILVRRSPRD